MAIIWPLVSQALVTILEFFNPRLPICLCSPRLYPWKGSLLKKNMYFVFHRCDLKLRMVLRWDNLTLTYQSHGRETIHDVSGHVRRGECHLLAGDRAPLIKCLLQTLSGWLGPLQEGCGSLTWSGHECKPREWFSRVGFVPCDEVWERRFTVREHLLRSVRLRRWSVTSEEERYRLVREALEFFKLEAIADKSVGRSHHSSRLSKIERKIFPVGKWY